MNRIEAMNVFARVAELGSFSAAASQLGIARSMVTRQVASLESFLGAKLLVRTTRHVSLTSAGQAYLEKCREIFSLLEEAESGVMEERHTPSGRLHVSLPLSFGLSTLTPLLMEFQHQYPDISLALDFNDRTINLVEEGIDLSIRITSYLDPGLTAHKITEARLLTVASPRYLAKHGHPQHPVELSQHACLGYSPQVNGRPWTYMVSGTPELFYPAFAMQANNGEALVQAALKDLGITLLPDFIVAQHVLDHELVVVLEAFEPPPLGVYLVLPSNRYVPLRVRVLLDYLSDRISKITPALNRAPRKG